MTTEEDGQSENKLVFIDAVHGSCRLHLSGKLDEVMFWVVQRSLRAQGWTMNIIGDVDLFKKK